MNKSKFTEVWKDPVQGSWWKALVVFISYWLLRIKTEQLTLIEGLRLSGDKFKMKDLENIEVVTKIMAKASIWMLIYTILLLVFLLIMSKLFKFKLFDFTKLNRDDFWFTIKTYLIFLVLAFILSNLILYFNPDYQTAQNQAGVESMVSGMNVALAFLYVVILIPITEEILFRGLIMKYIFPLMPVVGAIVSSVTFAGIHLIAGTFNIWDFLTYYTLSIAITFVYWRTRKLEYSIIYHMIQNGLAFAVMTLIK